MRNIKILQSNSLEFEIICSMCKIKHLLEGYYDPINDAVCCCDCYLLQDQLTRNIYFESNDVKSDYSYEFFHSYEEKLENYIGEVGGVISKMLCIQRSEDHYFKISKENNDFIKMFRKPCFYDKIGHSIINYLKMQ